MSAARRTLVLAVVVLLLGAVDLIAQRPTTETASLLPSIAAFEGASANEITLSHGDQVVRFELREDGWWVVSPYQAKADQGSVLGLLNSARRGVVMDARVDQGNLDRYGLDGGQGVRVQVEGDSGTLADFYLGANGDQGTSYVRFPDDDAIYRARLGGRSRFERPLSDWRDHQLLSFEPEAVRELAVTRGGQTRVLVADSERRWRFERGSEPVDALMVGALLEGLGHLRAGTLRPEGGVDGDDAIRVRVTMVDGEIHRVSLARQGEDWVAALDGRQGVAQVSGSGLDLLVARWTEWRSKELLHLDVAEVEGLIYQERSLTSELVLQGDAWVLVRPPRVEIDPRAALLTVRALARMRVLKLVSISPRQAGFPSSRSMELRMRDGSRRSLEIGAVDPASHDSFEAVFVRTADQPDRIGVVPARTLARIAEGWGR